MDEYGALHINVPRYEGGKSEATSVEKFDTYCSATAPNRDKPASLGCACLAIVPRNQVGESTTTLHPQHTLMYPQQTLMYPPHTLRSTACTQSPLSPRHAMFINSGPSGTVLLKPGNYEWSFQF
ncbi:hypothetical protein J6590_039366 [Homalodisca vitripennis]|nr:hypothetical protein J6590_039366 [Homalodisca vitripennis]